MADDFGISFDPAPCLADPALGADWMRRACARIADPVLKEMVGKFSFAELFDPVITSVESRFTVQGKTFEGQERWMIVEAIFVSDVHKTLHLFDSTGTPLLQRSLKMNARFLASAILKYRDMFLRHGLMQHMRGRFLCIPGEDPRPEARDLVGGATVLESIYAAIKESPNNRYCKLVQQQGFTAIEIKKCCPPDLARWIKHTANSYHGGHAMTLPEMMDDQAISEKSWNAEMRDKGIKSTSLPTKGELRYDKQYEKHIRANFPELVPDKWDDYGALKTFSTLLQKPICGEGQRAYLNFKKAMETSCDFHHPQLKNPTVVANAHMFLKALLEYADVWDPEVLIKIFDAGVPFLFPLIKSEDNEVYGPFLFAEVRPEKFKSLQAPMAGSLTMTKKEAKKQAAEKKAQEKNKETVEEPAPKRPRKRKSGVAGEEEQAIVPLFVVPEVIPSDKVANAFQEQRQVRILDDVISCVFGPVSGLRSDAIMWGELKICVIKMLRFMWTDNDPPEMLIKETYDLTRSPHSKNEHEEPEGSPKIPEERSLGSWSAVREYIRNMVIGVHQGPLERLASARAAVANTGVEVDGSPSKFAQLVPAWLPLLAERGGGAASSADACGSPSQAVIAAEVEHGLIGTHRQELLKDERIRKKAEAKRAELLEEAGWVSSACDFLQELGDTEDQPVKYRPHYVKAAQMVLQKLSVGGGGDLKKWKLVDLLREASFNFVTMLPEAWGSFASVVYELAQLSWHRGVVSEETKNRRVQDTSCSVFDSEAQLIKFMSFRRDCLKQLLLNFACGAERMTEDDFATVVQHIFDSGSEISRTLARGDAMLKSSRFLDFWDRILSHQLAVNEPMTLPVLQGLMRTCEDQRWAEGVFVNEIDTC